MSEENTSKGTEEKMSTMERKSEYYLYFDFSIPQSQATIGGNRMKVIFSKEEERDMIYQEVLNALKDGRKIIELGKLKNRMTINLSLVIAVEKLNVGEK